MKKDAYYFPHFANARNDRKLRRLRKELGVEGYGIYFMVLEVLREQKDFRYPVKDIDLLADEFRTSDQKVKVVVCNYDLFEIDKDEQFFSPNFIEYLRPYLERKERNRINGIKGNLIKWGYATKSQVSGMPDEEIMRLNDNKHDLSGGDSQGDRNKSKTNQSKINENTIAQQAETLYDIYPRKVAKEKAIKSIGKALREEEFEMLMQKVTLFTKCVAGQDKQYIPYPATWFNQARWKDDPDEWTTWKKDDDTNEPQPQYLTQRLDE